MKSPLNYRTSKGLVAKIKCVAARPTTVAIARWLSDAQWVMVNKWSWKEKEIAMLIAMHKSNQSPYTPCS